MGVTLKFVGVHAAFADYPQVQSSLLLTMSDNTRTFNLLVDCGNTVPGALSRLDPPVKIKDINAVYITHLHGDHIHGLERFALTRYFMNKNKEKEDRAPNPYIIGMKWLLDRLWDKSLAGGLTTIEKVDANLSTYFTVVGLSEDDTVIVNHEADNLRTVQSSCAILKSVPFQMYPVQTMHVMAKATFMPSYGIFVTANKKLFYPGDTQFAPAQIREFYNEADIIVHDCETTQFASGVHAHYNDLKTLPEEIKAKMWLIHYQTADQDKAKADGFAGFAEMNQTMEL